MSGLVVSVLGLLLPRAGFESKYTAHPADVLMDITAVAVLE